MRPSRVSADGADSRPPSSSRANQTVWRVNARRLVSGRACEMAVAVLAAAHGTPTSPGA